MHSTAVIKTSAPQCKNVLRREFLKKEDVYSLPRTGPIKHITNNSRIITVDWLIDFYQEKNYSYNTLYAAVNIFDRFCAARKEMIPNNKIQHYAAVCLQIASKAHERVCLLNSELNYYSESQNTDDEFRQTREEIGDLIKYKTSPPSPLQYICITQEFLPNSTIFYRLLGIFLFLI
jgi:hypothetical protein